MTVTQLRRDMGQWEFAHWMALADLRKRKVDREERRRNRKRR